MAQFYRGIPYLSQRRKPRNFSAFDFQHAALFRIVANLSFCNPSSGNQLMDCTYGGRRGYHDARRNKTDINVGNDHVPKRRRDGPYTVRYCSGTCFFFRFRQNCRYQMFFFHLRDVTSPFLLICSAPFPTLPSLSHTLRQCDRSSSHSARCVLETLLLWVASFLETHFFLSQTLAAT